MRSHIIRLMIGLWAALLPSLPLATPSAKVGAVPYNGHTSASSVSDVAAVTRASTLDNVASLEGSVAAVGISGTFAYVGAGSSLVTLDIGNPAQPNRLARLTLGGGDITNLQAAGDRAYLTYADGALRIVDIHDPRRPTLLSTHNLDLVHIQVIGNLAYAIVQGGSLQIYDVSNPLDLSLRGSYAPTSGFYALDMHVVGGLAYVASYDSGFQIIDLRDPGHPRLLGRFFDQYFTGVSVNVSRAYLIRQANNGSTYLDVIDISQSSRPKRLGSLQTKALRDLQAAGSLVYAVGDDGLHMIDVGQPAAPREISAYPIDIYRAPYVARSAIAVEGNLAYLAAGENGLLIIDATNPAGLTLRGKYVTIGFAADVQVVGNLAYVAAGSHLRILDVSDPSHPIQRGSYFLHSQYAPGILLPVGVGGIQVRGNLAYVFSNFVPTSCCQVGVMAMLDISEPANPILRGSISDTGYNDIQVVGQRAYLTGRFRLNPAPVLAIIDVSNPASPTELGRYGGRYDDQNPEDRNGAAAVDIAGSLAYVADDSAGLKIIDVSNPVSPTLRSVLDTAGSANDIQVAGDLAYIADGERGLLIVDISNPASPIVRGSLQTADSAMGVRLAGSLAYIAAGTSGIQIVDVSDPARPIPRGRYDTPGYARHVDVAGDLIYVADQDEGLQILKLLPLPSVSATIPTGGGTLISPTDATTYAFAAGTFPSTVVVTHTIRFADSMPPTGSLAGGHTFDVVARDSLTGQPVQPTKPYSITIQYGDTERGPAIESTLALYFWEGSTWIKEPSSAVDLAAHTLTATPSHFSIWALLGETRRAFMPLAKH